MKTPLEVEIKMLTSDLEVKEEEMRYRILSFDSEVNTMDDYEIEYHVWEMEKMMDMSAENERMSCTSWCWLSTRAIILVLGR